MPFEFEKNRKQYECGDFSTNVFEVMVKQFAALLDKLSNKCKLVRRTKRHFRIEMQNLSNAPGKYGDAGGFKIAKDLIQNEGFVCFRLYFVLFTK